MSQLSRKDDALLTRTADIVFGGADAEALIDHLPRPRQVFAIIYSAQGIIDNGGFQYLFESDWPNKPPYTMFSDAYREVGATDVADWLDQAASMFPFSPTGNPPALPEDSRSLTAPGVVAESVFRELLKVNERNRRCIRTKV
jgi:hypothetical protein